MKVPAAYFTQIIPPDVFEDAAFSFESEVMADARESMASLDDQYLYLEDVEPLVRAEVGNSDNWSVRVEQYWPGPFKAEWQKWDGFLEYIICRPAFEAPSARLRIERPSWWPA